MNDGPLLISDANIFMDLYDAGIIDRLFQLPCAIHTTDLIIHELRTPGLMDRINAHIADDSLTVKRFSGEDMMPLYSGNR